MKKTLILNPTRVSADGYFYDLPKDIPKGEIIAYVGWDGRLFFEL